ncbi:MULTISPECIES: lipopolysaccharide biosynthesis protein [Hallerella]|uniref:lipopolysaccharide biosynthesis protein n=1 Tax=Hallerella TaxID=2815788 RepID=UPI000D0D5698|nr:MULTISPECIES: lipopolysaccharide biosynthesis protein [Hallerella]MCI6872646.1 lipopolysaccharide biosynthesis protein [Hallerella sp.]MDY5028946.1 lipopolysaccharide biosynthesis protein [Hallerella succinigenes]
MASETPGLTETLFRILNNDLKHFKLCCALVLIPTIVVFVLVMWVIKPTYAAKAVVTPPPDNSSMSTLSGMLDGELSSYASLLGFASGSVDADAIWTIFDSKELQDMVIDHFKLAEHYEFDGQFRADLLKQFRKNFELSLTDENMLEISIEDEDYRLASEMATFMLDKADSMFNAFKTKQARQSREYFDNRIELCLKTLDSLQQDFVKFQADNNFYEPEVQMEATINYLSTLQTERQSVAVEMNYESQLRGTDSKRYGELSKRYNSLNTAIHQTLNGKQQSMGLITLKKSPQLGAEYMRKQEEVKVQAALYKLLRQQSEQMQLEEAKKLTNLHVLEAPWPNDKKVSPLRGASLIFTVFVSMLLATILCNFIELVKSQKGTGSSLEKEWATFVGFFRRKRAN